MNQDEPIDLIVEILNLLGKLKEESFSGDLVINFDKGEIERIEQWEDLDQDICFDPSRCPDNPRWN